MRRVYDDASYSKVSENLLKAFCSIKAETVSEYDYGMYRAKVSKIKENLLRRVPNIKFGSTSHANGIGNNNAIEIVCLGDPNEEQICGLLHLTDDMFGGVIFWVSDIDGERRTSSWKIVGCNKKDTYDMKYKRNAMRER